MFTGIIRHVGELTRVTPTGDGAQLTIALGPLARPLGVGDSVAVNGACLTVARLDGETGTFDAVAETLQRSTLGALRAPARVNLEPAVAAGDALDGHIVQGHVDGVAEVRSVDRAGQWRVTLQAPRALTDAMILKGSVALDGASLTIAELGDGRLAVAVIPTTLAETTIGDWRAGTKVNVETDVIGKYVRKYLAGIARAGGLTIDKLRDSGFA